MLLCSATQQKRYQIQKKLAISRISLRWG